MQHLFWLSPQKNARMVAMKRRKQLVPRDLEFLYEVGSLRHIKRSWSRFLTPEFQNLADHHLRVVWIAMIIAKHEGVKNIEKIVSLAILHDVPESRTGDVDYLQRQYVKRNEELGVKDIFAGTVFEKEFTSLWKEYEKRDSIESKIVKDADTLDVDLEIKEQENRGNKVGIGWKKNRIKFAEKLFTKTAKELWKAIQTSNPHDWHYKGRNRFNDGDLKK